MTQIAFRYYDQMTALDAVGPHEVPARLPGAEAKFMASTPDMALTLAAMEAGEDEARAIQLVIEHDPDPPFDSGSFAAATPDIQQRATAAAA